MRRRVRLSLLSLRALARGPRGQRPGPFFRLALRSWTEPRRGRVPLSGRLSVVRTLLLVYLSSTANQSKDAFLRTQTLFLSCRAFAATAFDLNLLLSCLLLALILLTSRQKNRELPFLRCFNFNIGLLER